MARFLTCTFVVMLTAFSASARQITPDEAFSSASAFMKTSELQTISLGKRPMKASGMVVNTAESPFYIFNRGDKNGFIIISGDDRAPRVLGYSDHGNFDSENIPPQLKAMMEQWSLSISSVPEGKPVHPSWSSHLSSTRAVDGILLETAEWGQGYPYNVYCPIIEGEQAPAGCVATAMAIAMKYHNWPDYTRGGIQDDFNYPEFTFDFSNYNIDWDVLKDEKNPKFADEVGRLMQTAGIAAQMFYGPYESSSEMWALGHKMIELYSYAKGCQYIEKSKFSDAEWTSMLINQLREVGPVIYRGSGDIGHAFVIDGYDGDSLFHVNWGWDGLLNGYYTLDFADVGGSSFSENQGMIINIRPDKERKEYSKSFVPNCDVYITSTGGGGGWNFMKPDIDSGERIDFKAPSITLNGHVGYFDIGIVDENDNILQVLGMGHHNNDPNRHCEYPGMTLEYSMAFPGLKDGQRYQLISMEATLDEDGIGFADPRSEDPKDWKLILGGIVYPSYFYDKNNRSEVCDVNFHIDENLPILFTNFNTTDREFTVHKLKGGDCADNILKPVKGVTMEIKCTDKDGNPEQPLYVGSTEEGECISLNISMYSDIFDVYLHYDYDGDTRKDKDVDPQLIIEKDGLIYKRVDGGVHLIGYDEVEEDVIIPESVCFGETELPVLSVANDALLFAPIKTLTIKASMLESLENCAFGGIDCLESLSMEGLSPVIPWTFPFLNTKIEKVYMDRGFQNRLMNKYMNLNWNWFGSESPAIIYSDDIDFYLSELGDPYDHSHYTNCIYVDGISMVLSEGWLDKVMGSYNVPGLGDIPVYNYIKSCPVPIQEMWSYAIDREHGCVRIEPLIDEISIQSVAVNGQEISGDESFLYFVASTENMEVTVKYLLNGRKEMTTVYNPYYNNAVEDRILTDAVDVVSEPAENVRIYSSDGMMISESVDGASSYSLKPGIYVVRKGNQTKKLIVR
ncbi:MAG: thiol protease/hemagglutinin PrtT [Muribaculaceae bacterium]|nr:thiol protease/hemagglutinin PrtT [Muribaculaceae bacterium]